MKLDDRDRAALSALWGTVFLFLLPITAGILTAQSGLSGALIIIAVSIGCVISAIVGAIYFWQAVSYLTLYSKAKVTKTQDTADRSQ